MSVGRHNTLSRSAAAGRTGPAQATSSILPLSTWPCGTLHGGHRGGADTMALRHLTPGSRGRCVRPNDLAALREGAPRGVLRPGADVSSRSRHPLARQVGSKHVYDLLLLLNFPPPPPPPPPPPSQVLTPITAVTFPCHAPGEAVLEMG